MFEAIVEAFFALLWLVMAVLIMVLSTVFLIATIIQTAS